MALAAKVAPQLTFFFPEALLSNDNGNTIQLFYDEYSVMSEDTGSVFTPEDHDFEPEDFSVLYNDADKATEKQ